MKVVIIGAGLSGLSTAIALRKYVSPSDGAPLEIRIFEKHSDNGGPPDDGERLIPRRLGVGLGLQSNGLRVLDHLDPELRKKVYASGYPCDHFKWKTSGDTLLSREYVDVLPVSRPLLIDCLAEFLPVDLVEYRKVSNVLVRKDCKPIIQFDDGSPEEIVDLVIGADGVGSVVRKGLFGENEKYRPYYLGICGVGGVLDIELPRHLLDDPSMIFFIGSSGTFGYTGLTQTDKNKLLYWSVYNTELPERGRKFDHDVLLKQLRERHANWGDPLIAKCLEKSQLDNIYPVFVMPDLPYWGRDGCVLLGDAAHALSPRSGQGASQAFEDGLTFALLLAERMRKNDVPNAISLSVSDVYTVRHTRVNTIRIKALAWKDPEMPMPRWKISLVYIFVFLYVKVLSVMRLFTGKDDWDAKVEVEKYLGGLH